MIAAGLVSTRAEYFRLFDIYVPIALGVFVVICVTVLGAVLRYRRRESGGGDSSGSDNNPLELSYAGLLVLVVAFLLYLTLTVEHKVDTVANHERPTLTVDVVAAKWEWEFDYPRYGIVERSGFVGNQPLVVPADRAIRFNLNSQDVIHSLWIPELRFKRDLIRGTTEHVTLTFTHLGTFAGQCAEFCGLRHPEMVFRVRVLPATQFASWVAAHRAAGTT